MKQRNLWPWGIALTLTVFFFGTVGLIVLACSQRVDLVNSDYYDDELQFQRQIDSRHRAESVPVNVAYDARAQSIRISFPTAAARSLTAGHIKLYRPDAAELDRKLNLKLDANGSLTVNASQLRRGLWRVKLFWTEDKLDYSMEKEIVIGGDN